MIFPASSRSWAFAAAARWKRRARCSVNGARDGRAHESAGAQGGSWLSRQAATSLSRLATARDVDRSDAQGRRHVRG